MVGGNGYVITYFRSSFFILSLKKNRPGVQTACSVFFFFLYSCAQIALLCDETNRIKPETVNKETISPFRLYFSSENRINIPFRSFFRPCKRVKRRIRLLCTAKSRIIKCFDIDMCLERESASG